jgi:dCMP deaminase
MIWNKDNYTPCESTKQWDSRFLALCDLIASWSKDPSTKVGAVVVDAEHVIRATGYNGLARGVRYGDQSRILERPKKYSFAVHAEANAVVHAGRDVAKGCTLYLTTLPKERSSLPCTECTKLVIQAGIKEVVCRRIKYEMQPGDPKDTWRDTINQYSIEMFDEAGVTLREVGL